jgi:hypothetical protein
MGRAGLGARRGARRRWRRRRGRRWRRRGGDGRGGRRGGRARQAVALKEGAGRRRVDVLVCLAVALLRHGSWRSGRGAF